MLGCLSDRLGCIGRGIITGHALYLQTAIVQQLFWKEQVTGSVHFPPRGLFLESGCVKI